ncbi:hypothetical protein MPSEU_000965800 [Mayamaea pseudoterrestris]|nr:hypothetical protein MPSEU_000965100 [Mayamaea pseudoterrestris]GKZ00124.1 hypothetical protein MPSEU_000965800 [Mayamaea pseudoterrestris]
MASAYLRSLLSRPLAVPMLWYASMSIFDKQPSASKSARCEAEVNKNNNASTKETKQQQLQARLIFLGTGSSTGCPRPLCTMLFRGASPSHDPKVKDYFDCTVSNLAVPFHANNPANNKNYRNNPSLLLQTENGCITIIDVGKTFREGALRWFPRYQIGSIDSIVLTHEHMDAAGGLDDVRGFQQYAIINDKESQQRRTKVVPMPLHLSQHCYNDLQQRFPWLLPQPASTIDAAAASSDESKPVVQRHVATFQVETFEAFQPFLTNDGQLEITPLPVMHGEDLISYGFSFTIGTLNVVYLSDISRMLPSTLDYILDKPTDILIVDALHEAESNAVHYTLHEALALVATIQPKQTYFVGMSCDSFLPHDDMNKMLAGKYGNVAFAHDGLEILA